MKVDNMKLYKNHCQACGVGAGRDKYYGKAFYHIQGTLKQYKDHLVCDDCLEWLERTPECRQKNIEWIR